MRLLFSSSPYSIKTLFQLRSFPASSLLFATFANSEIVEYMAFSRKSSAALNIPPDVSSARRFWYTVLRESLYPLYSPFALCLVSGTLKSETFRHYLAQEAHFLKAVAQVYALAEDYADDDSEKLAISEMRKGALKELEMHDSFVQEWGSDIVKESPVNSATLKFTEFLLSTASGKIEALKAPGKLVTPFEKTKIAAYAVGAVTACTMLYTYLGMEFEELVEPYKQNHPYKKWIDKYSSQIFQASALKTEDLLDKLSVSLTGEELNVIEKLYQQAMKLEIEFFYAQPLNQPTVVPLTKELDPAQDRLVIFSGFDLTCTNVDSSAILAELAIVTASKSDQNPLEEGEIARMSSTELRSSWNLISTQYTEEYEQCIESILPTDKVEFNYEALHKALEQLVDFEKRANSRVIESGVLKGLNLENIKRAGELLTLQNGCLNFFQKITKNENLNANVHIISYCWCGDFVRAAFSSGGLNVLNIHANELSFEESVSTGEIVGKVQSPHDKVQAFDDIIQGYSNDRKNLTVYIGDAMGDLLCLLKADIGIVLGSSLSLRRVGEQYGVSFVPLLPGLIKKQMEYADGSPCFWKGQSGILYTASGWDDIHALILGLGW